MEKLKQQKCKCRVFLVLRQEANWNLFGAAPEQLRLVSSVLRAFRVEKRRLKTDFENSQTFVSESRTTFKTCRILRLQNKDRLLFAIDSVVCTNAWGNTGYSELLNALEVRSTPHRVFLCLKSKLVSTGKPSLLRVL